MIVRRVHQIAGLAAIQEVRRLPRPGRVLVEQGQKVRVNEIVAETLVGKSYALLDGRSLLSLGEDVEKVRILCKEGQRVKAGDALVQVPGVPPRTLRAPQAGRVLLAGDGQVLLETAHEAVNLPAGLMGEVVAIEENRGVVLQAEGAIIEGLWGNGRFESGSLFVSLQKPDAILQPEDVDVSKRGMVVVGGSCLDAETLKTAKDSPVRGLILSSIHPDLLSLARRMPFPVMTTDGLGRRPMNSAAFKLLTTNAERTVMVFAQEFHRLRGARPKAVIDVPGMSGLAMLDAIRELAPGDTVLLTMEPYPGAVGIIHRILPRRQKLPNGVRAYVAQVNLENGERVSVPLMNLELLP